MTHQSGLQVEGNDVRCGRGGGVEAGGEKTGKAEGETGKINTTTHFFTRMAKKGDLLWGNDDLCQG